MTQLLRQRSTARTQGDVRRSGPNNACALHKLLDEHDMPTSSVDANLQIRELSITAPWDTRRHIPNHVDAALAVADFHDSAANIGSTRHGNRVSWHLQNNATTCPRHRVRQRPSTGTNMTGTGGFRVHTPELGTPPGAARAALAGPRSPAQLTSFCPAPLGHLGKPANGSRGREIQRSTSCNPRILQGRGMFDGKAFLLGEGFSRGGSLFSIIFKLWYKRTPLTGKPRHERPPLPPQICLGYVLNMRLSETYSGVVVQKPK